MNNSLSVTDHLLDRGRQFIRLGQTADAHACLTRLLALPDLDASVRCEGHRLLAHLEMGCQRFRAARRHLRAAARLKPYEADLYCQYAIAVAADPDGDPVRARKALGRAVGINPYEPRYWAALGTALVRTGERRPALRAFRRAARLRPEDPGTLWEALNGLVALGRCREAIAALTAARLRAPRDARLRDVGSRLYFEMARRDQEATRRAVGGAPVVLAFPGRGPAPSEAAGSPGIVRVDRRSRPVPHLLRMFGVGPRQAR